MSYTVFKFSPPKNVKYKNMFLFAIFYCVTYLLTVRISIILSKRKVCMYVIITPKGFWIVPSNIFRIVYRKSTISYFVSVQVLEIDYVIEWNKLLNLYIANYNLMSDIDHFNFKIQIRVMVNGKTW